MNRVIKLLLISDIFFLTGFGFIEPIFAVFITENLVGGSVVAVGLASSIFWIVKSMVQIPFSRHVDTHGDVDDIKWLIIGGFFIVLTPIAYLFTTHIYWIYAIQVFYGISAGLAYPAWLGLWSTHLDKKKESFEWSLYSASVGVGSASAAFIGASIAQYVGFKVVFMLVAVMAFIGWSVLFQLVMNKKGLSKKFVTAYHKKRKLTKTQI